MRISPYAYPGKKKIRLFENRTVESFNRTLAVIAYTYGVTSNDLLRPCRKQEIIEPRQIAQYILRHHFKLTWPDIAYLFGGINHATVISNTRTVKNRMETEDWYRAQMDKLIICLPHADNKPI